MTSNDFIAHLFGRFLLLLFAVVEATFLAFIVCFRCCILFDLDGVYGQYGGGRKLKEFGPEKWLEIYECRLYLLFYLNLCCVFKSVCYRWTDFCCIYLNINGFPTFC